ncbi:T9SS type A sorting domain-containing protein [Psychroserpens luteus]|uniref:T9SS type A sorting domain-containing protein n=1 Tax=Psychroserpens luteus TaxID=1434066 RepID=A0ABW5ZRJ3_9FLAO|nr:T9SS type A sorting domain-containing protein [Psychroserpens luteus]
MKSLLLLVSILMTSFAFGQHEVLGTVTDLLGQIASVNVTVKNSKTGTFTDIDGNYTVNAKPTDTLQFTHIGYKPVDVIIGNLKRIDVNLDGFQELDEVVLVGYSSASCASVIRCSWHIVYVTDEHSKRINDSETIKLYPNPSKDGIFNIKLLEDVSEVKIIVADLTGRIILNRAESKLNSNFVVDLSNQPTGIYIINVSSNGTQIASKKAIRI